MNKKIVKFSVIETAYTDKPAEMVKISELTDTCFIRHGFTPVPYAGETYYVSEMPAEVTQAEEAIEELRLQLPGQRIHMHELMIWDLNPVVIRSFSPKQ